MTWKAADCIRVLLVDDHALFLEGVERLLAGQNDFFVVGAVRSLMEAQRCLQQNTVDVILLDFDLGTERALPFLSYLQQASFEGEVLIVTAGVSDAEAVMLVQAGVKGIFHKHHGSAALCDAVRQVAGGQPYLEAAYLGSLFTSLRPDHAPGPPRLNEREVKILRMILQGMINKEIAGELRLTEAGVKSALRLLFQKLGVKTRSQAVRVALEQYQTQL